MRFNAFDAILSEIHQFIVSLSSLKNILFVTDIAQPSFCTVS